MNLMRTTLLSSAVGAVLMAPSANAVFTINLENGDKIELGGYAKADYRLIDGNLNYRDVWIGNNPGVVPDGLTQTRFNIRESRLSTRYTRGDVSAYVEIDFMGSDGNEVVTNSFDDRVRHFFITYKKNWLFGQTWSTFMPLAAIPESLDLGAGHAGKVFIRQPMVRFTYGGFSVALENPETVGGQGNANDSVPDLAARYIYKADWGQVGVAGLVRRVDAEGIDDTAVAGNIH
ncbi:MAG: DcaP family trimeric outer membrane transporter, partial [Pseudomonadota bacterium]